MDVKFTVIGAKPNSDEYQGALKLKAILEESMPNSAEGEIILHPNATIMGASVNDVDLLVMGYLRNYSEKLLFTNSEGEIERNKVDIFSFCTAVEIKSHPIRLISREGTEFFVKYAGKAGFHSVTSQSNDQKTAVRNFLKAIVGSEPYVTNIIWFTGITENELNGILKVNDGSQPMMSNTLPDNFKARDFFQRIIWQKMPKHTSKGYLLDCKLDQQGTDTFAQYFQSFAERKTQQGELTRARIELITSKAISGGLLQLGDDQMNIYRGRAGTGKTIGLIQAAIKYVDEKDARVIILTYNAALVSDIKRLFALAELPDVFQESCVTIDTMHRFFYKLVSTSLKDGTLSRDDFVKNYDNMLGEMLEYLNDESDAKAFLKDIMGRNYFLNWDYCFIDEAQDWTINERDLILKIFGPEHIIVADGGQQFVRKVAACDWGIVESRKNIKLKNCLRQKTNLIKFINHYLDSINRSDQRIISPEKLSGGNVILCASGSNCYPVFQRELKAVKEDGNIPYDMMFLVPSSMVYKEPRCFKYTADFQTNGIPVWDGTNPMNRSSVNLLGDSVRVLQYDSARGLEAWTVVCMWLDVFLNEKLKYYDDSAASDALILESKEERLQKYLLNWLLLPLTRAIDTLVITFKDPRSDIAKTFIQLARTNPDYITVE